MPARVTLFTERAGFAPQWRPALEQQGLTVQVCHPNELGRASDGAIVIDADSNAYDDDELLLAVGFARARHLIVAVSSDDASPADDVLVEMCSGLVARGAQDVPRIASAIARRSDPERRQRFEFVTVSPRDQEVLAVLGDGQSILLDRPLENADDRGEVVAIELAEDARTARLVLQSGVCLDLRASTIAPHESGTNGASALPIDGARLGARLRELRLEAGLTQAELARRTGIHRPNIARVEAGRHTPSLETLARLASAIGVSTTRVLSDD